MKYRTKDFRELGYYCDCCKYATFVWNEWDECPYGKKLKTLWDYQ